MQTEDVCMPKMPEIPSEKRSFSVEKTRDRLRSAQPDRRDETFDNPPRPAADVSPGQSR